MKSYNLPGYEDNTLVTYQNGQVLPGNSSEGWLVRILVTSKGFAFAMDQKLEPIQSRVIRGLEEVWEELIFEVPDGTSLYVREDEGCSFTLTFNKQGVTLRPVLLTKVVSK